MAILYDKKSLLENKKFLTAVSELYTASPEDAAARVENLVSRHRI